MSTSQPKSNNRSNRGRGRGKGSNQPRTQQSQPQQPVFLPPPNYADPERIKAEQLEQQKIKERLKQNEQLAEAAKSKPPAPKKAEYIEEGKSILSSFFNGFNSLERGNVKVEFDNTLGDRVAAEYYDAIETHVDRATDFHQSDDDIEKLTARKVSIFNSITNLSIAIKLGKSGTDDDKKRTKSLSLLNSNTNVTLPKKLGVIINQLGKTDLNNDNHLRIDDQGLRAKQMLVRGVFSYFPKSKSSQYLKEGKSLDDLFKYIFDPTYLSLMIDDNSLSVDFIQHVAVKRFNTLREKQNIKVKFANNLVIDCSIPYFNLSDPNITEDKIVEYLSNKLWTGELTTSNKMVVPNIVAIIVTPLLTIGAIRKPDKTLSELFNSFTGTILADVTIAELLDVMGIWNINRWIDDNDLDDLSSYVYNDWQNNGRRFYSEFLDMQEINFTTFGTDAQMVEIKDSSLTSSTDSPHIRSKHGFNVYRIKDKAKALCKFKISETGAIFGSALKFNKGVRFTSDYEVQFTGKNHKILSEFLRKDFLK